MSKYVLIAFDFRGRMEIIRFMFSATGVKVRREKNLHFVQNSTVKFSQPCVFDYFSCNKSSMLRNGHLPVLDSRGYQGRAPPPLPPWSYYFSRFHAVFGGKWSK